MCMCILGARMRGDTAAGDEGCVSGVPFGLVWSARGKLGSCNWATEQLGQRAD